MAGGFRSRSTQNQSSNKSAGHTPARETNSNQRRSGNRAPSARGHNGRSSNDRGSSKAQRGRVDAPRIVAVRALIEVSEHGAYANLVLPKLLRAEKLSGLDAAFATELLYGTLRAQGIVDAVLAKVSSRSLQSMAPEVRAALRLGVYQLLFTRVGQHAAVDTTVELVAFLGQERARGFVNGILRTVTRTPVDVWLERLQPRTELGRLAFRHSHPEWIAQSFARVLGMHDLEAALEADSQRPVVHLAARPGELSAEELAVLTGGEVGAYSPYAVYLESGDPGDLEPVKQSLAQVQDEGSQVIARALAEAPTNGQDSGRWLDLCAGPGGKAALLGGLARVDGARVDAVEPAAHRAALVEKSCEGLPVDVHVADGRDSGLAKGYDRILVDAPCSGLGALRRRPDARWRKQESDIDELTGLQYALASAALDLLRPGGVMVYSTCSPDLRETRGIVDQLLKNNQGQVEELDAHPLACGMEDLGRYPSVQMWPHKHGTDAMFFSVLRKL